MQYEKLFKESIAKAKSIQKYEHIFKGLETKPVTTLDNVLMFFRQHAEAAAFLEHQHHRFMIVANLGSDCTFCLDGNVMDFPEKAVVCIFPHQFHNYLEVEPGLNWLFMTFDIFNISSALSSLRYKIIKLDTMLLTIICRALDLYKSAYRKAEPLKLRHLNVTLSFLLYELLSRPPANASSILNPDSKQALPQYKLIDEINEFIFKNFDKSLTISSIAEHIGISSSHLWVIFKKNFKTSLGKYIQKIKMDKAKIELSLPDKTIEEIAYEFGFSSINSFSGSFKRLNGICPSEYRKRAGTSSG